MHRPDEHQGVDELLQADVMRFMAIIAFCLIAILALVHAAEVPAARPPERPAPEMATPATAPVRIESPAAAVAPPSFPPPARPSEPVRESVAAADPVTEAVEKPVVQPLQEGAPQPVREPVSEPAAPPEPDRQGLSLRFASDRDFLRLLSRGEIRAFAFRDGTVLAVSQDLTLRPASAPGRLYELLPETIPDLMSAALEGADRGAGFRWGVVLPEHVVRAIREHLQAGASGTLVIDRFGEVRLSDA